MARTRTPAIILDTARSGKGSIAFNASAPTDLNDTDDVGHSARVEHFVEFVCQEEVDQVVERVRHQPAEGGEELEPEVWEVTQPDGQVLDHVVDPHHRALLRGTEADGLHLRELPQVVPAAGTGGGVRVIFPGELSWLGRRVLCRP